MGRHRSTNSRSGVAKELVYGVIAVIVVIALVVGWLTLRKSTSEEHASETHCPAGDISLPFALLGTTTSLDAIQQEYLDTHPIIQDHCVTSFTGAKLDSAALVYSSLGDQDTKAELGKISKTAATSEWPIVGMKDVGIAVPAGHDEISDWATATDVAFITEQPLAAQLAGATMKTKPGSSIPRAKAVAEHKAFVTVDSDVPAGYAFVRPQQPAAVHLPTRMLAVGTSPAVTEEQSRAAAHFIDFAKKKAAEVQEPELGAIKSALAANPLPAEAAAPTTAPAAATPASDTLLLLDASEAMGPHFAEVTHGLSESAVKLGANGHHVGLWNYSSPQSAGVTRGWRNNVALDDASQGANAAHALTLLGYGGSPQTHEAVVASLSYAQRVAFESHKPVKVVLVTTGTADKGSQGALDAALKDIDPARVSLHVIRVGNGAADDELAGWAGAHGGTVTAAASDAELGQIFAKVLGV